MGLHFENSDELCKAVSEKSEGRVVLSFSCGKDSVAAWLQLKRYFTHIVPLFMHPLPGISFIDDAVKYYEDFFKTPIKVVWHPETVRMIRNRIFQPPERWQPIEDAGLFDTNKHELYKDVARESFPGFDVYAALGVRQSDTLARHAAVKKHGTWNLNARHFFAVYDWDKARMVAEFRKAGVRLPKDYLLYGRSFDGPSHLFLRPLFERGGPDWERAREIFPLAIVDTFRRHGIAGAIPTAEAPLKRALPRFESDPQ